MDRLKEITSRIALYIVDNSIKWSNALASGIDLDESVVTKSFFTGEEFIEYVRKTRFRHRVTHVALIGYTFYDEKNYNLMNGIEVLESLKKIKPYIEVIMLASDGEQEYGGYVKKMGAITFINKDDNALLKINNYLRILNSRKRLALYKKDFKMGIYLWVASIAALILWFIVS